MSKKVLIIVLILLAVVVGVSALALSNDSTSIEETGTEHDDPDSILTDLTAQTEVTVTIDNFAYTQDNIKIKRGTKVTWLNQDNVEHNVMAAHENSEHAHSGTEHDEVDPGVLAGPLLAKGESYSFTFNELGTVTYHCSPHPYMTGNVTVVD